MGKTLPSPEQIAQLITEDVDDIIAGEPGMGAGPEADAGPEGDIGAPPEGMPGEAGLEEPPCEPISLDKALLERLFAYCCEKGQADPECGAKLAQAALDHSKIESSEVEMGEPAAGEAGCMTIEDFDEIVAAIEGGAEEPGMGGEMGGEMELGGEEGAEGAEEGPPPFESKGFSRIDSSRQIIESGKKKSKK